MVHLSKSLAYCRGCGRPVDRETTKCPKCGLSRPLQKSNFLKWALLVLVAIAAGYAFILPREPDPPATQSAEDNKQAPMADQDTTARVAAVEAKSSASTPVG